MKEIDKMLKNIVISGIVVIIGLLAATERALSLKNHWLIDMETNTFDS